MPLSSRLLALLSVHFPKLSKPSTNFCCSPCSLNLNLSVTMNSAVPPNVNLSDNRAPEVYTSHITIYALTIIVVALRLIAKRVSNSSFWWDDWFILIAAVR